MARRTLLATVQSTSGSAQPLRMLVPTILVPPIVGSSLNFQLGATGGTPAYAYSLLSGSLPTGTSLSAAGLISGTTSASGHFIFIVQVQDSLGAVYPKSMSITVTTGHSPVQVTPTTGERGVVYSYQLVMADSSGSTSGFTYSVLTGAMPGGLSLSSGGLISGTPTAPAVGTTVLTVRGTKSSLNLDVPVTIICAGPMSGATLTVSLPTGVVNQPVAGSITVSGGGVAPYAYEVTSGALPAGVALNRKTGKIIGTPTAFTPSAGWTNPVVTVTDFLGATNTVVVPFQINQGVKAAPQGHFVTLDSDGSPTDSSFLNLFLGDGSDGDFTCNGSNTLAGTTLSGGVNKATRDLYLNNLTSVAGGVLNMDSYNCYILGNWDVTAAPAGAIKCKGGNASLLVGGTAPRLATAGAAGTAGVNGVSAAGQDSPDVFYAAGGFGGGFNGGGTLVGKGGAGTAGASGNGGKGGTIQAPYTVTLQIFDSMIVDVAATDGTATVYSLLGGTGGGGGSAGSGSGAAAGGNSGAGGGSGGRARICAGTITTSVSTPAGVIDVGGGDGSPGVAGGGSGRGGGGAGSGGGAGQARLYYGIRNGPSVTDFIKADGGNGANGGNAGGGAGTAGVGGKGGKGGLIQITNLLTGVTTIATAAQPTNPTTQTGSAGTTCRGSL